MSGNRIPHAFLFYGMEGVGKRTISLVFAKALNCMTQQNDACGQCGSCLKAVRGNHPDLKIIEPKGQYIRIQEIRDLQQQMTFRPYDGGWRIFILVDAEKMNITAANALLKTLEEPTPANVLILISSRPYLLPPTVQSRCQPLRFSPLERDVVNRYLRERLAIPEGPAAILASASGGSIGRAVEMNDADYLSMRNSLLKQFLTIRQDPGGLFSILELFGQERTDILQRLDIIKTCLRDALVLKETGMPDSLMNRDCLDEIRTLAESRSTETLLKNMKTVDRAHRAIDQNANKTLTLETMMFRLVLTS